MISTQEKMNITDERGRERDTTFLKAWLSLVENVIFREVTLYGLWILYTFNPLFGSWSEKNKIFDFQEIL